MRISIDSLITLEHYVLFLRTFMRTYKFNYESNQLYRFKDKP